MPYSITFSPLNPIQGVVPKSVTKSTAAEAWMEVQQLQASDEKVEITAPEGCEISWQELRDIAAREAN